MFRVRCLALLLAVFALSACYRWSAPLWPTAPEVLQTRGGDLRVTPQNGPAFRLVNARITGDTLRGYALESHLFGGDTYRAFAMPLSDVRSVTIREFSRGRTAFLVGTVTVAVAAVVVIWGEGTHGHFNLAPRF